MKKILDLLEKNVQWVVLAVAVLYVGWAAYTYLMAPPVAVTVAGQKLMPGEIDAKTVSDVVTALEQKIKDPRVIQKPTSQPLVDQFAAVMSSSTEKPPVWPDAALVFYQLPPVKVTDAVAQNNSPNVPQPDAKGNKVAELVKLPAPHLAALRAGLTSVAPPGQPAGPAGANVAGIDKSWVSVRFDIDPKTISDAFDDAKIPAELSNTVIVQVKLERQESLPEAPGGWGPITVVPTLGNVTLQPMPPVTAPTTQATQYFEWAKTHQVDIVQPKFYDRIKGDEWVVPGQTAGVIVAAPKFDPSKYPTGDRQELAKQGLTPSEIDAVYAFRSSKAGAPRGNAPRAGRANTPATPVPQRSRTARPGPAPTPDAPPAQFDFLADAPTDRQVSFQAAAEENAPAEGVAAEAAQQGTFPMPNGSFDPHKYTAANGGPPVIIGWAHDETATPGHTYRYRVTYMLKNPVYFIANYVKDPATAKVIAIASAPSEWSSTIEISSTINFFIVKRGGTPNSVTAEIFRNQGGVINRKLFDVSAGDMIGTKEGAVDFVTGWTLVDLRNDPKTDTELYALLLDPAGNLHRRDLSTETKSSSYKALDTQARAGAKPVAAAP